MRAAIDNGWTVAFTILSARESYFMTAECRWQSTRGAAVTLTFAIPGVLTFV